MLTRLWKAAVGSGTIDVSVDASHQTVAAGDVSGCVFVLDYFGNVISDDISEELPIGGSITRIMSTAKSFWLWGWLSKTRRLEK